MSAQSVAPDGRPPADVTPTATVAVIAHSGKTLEGGLPELREKLDLAGVTDPLWSEVPKSKMAPKRVRTAIESGADLVFVWGGDGMVQRCIDAMVGSDAVLAIIPAGTANLFAANLKIPSAYYQLDAGTLYSSSAPPYYVDDIAVLLSYFQGSCA